MKGILFTEPMFLAATRDKEPKTQTRRMEDALTEINENPDSWELHSKVKKQDGKQGWRFVDDMPRTSYIFPRYQIGETIFLKEPFFVKEYSYGGSDVIPEAYVEFRYGKKVMRRFDISRKTLDKLLKWKSIGKWVSSLLMFADFARYHATITDVRCERLQDITPKDAIAEGIECIGEVFGVKQWKHYVSQLGDAGGWPVISYWSLWESIHGKESWEQNPYIFVYEFTVKPV